MRHRLGNPVDSLSLPNADQTAGRKIFSGEMLCMLTGILSIEQRVTAGLPAVFDLPRKLNQKIKNILTNPID